MRTGNTLGEGLQAHRGQTRYRLPAGARQILLIRHAASVGATDESVRVADLVITDPPLAPMGIAQTEALARLLATQAISHIFVTPVRRTQQTAAPFAAASGLEPIVLADLREVYLGDWEHSFYEHVASGHPILTRMYAEETYDVIPNAERAGDLSARVRRGIAAVVDATVPGDTAAVFSHAGTIAEICRQATGSRALAFVAPENTSVSRLVVHADGKWKLRSFNEMAHLGYE